MLAPYSGALVAVVLAFWMQEAGYHPGHLPLSRYLIPLTLILLLAILVTLRIVTTRAHLRIAGKEIAFPGIACFWKNRRLRTKEIRSYVRIGHGPSSRVFFSWAGFNSTRVYGPRSFVEPDALDRFDAAMTRALAGHPELDQVLLRGSLIARLRRAPRLCLAIAVALALVFCWQLIRSSHSPPVDALLSGALSPWLVWHQGEWFRLASAPLLHGGVLHLMLNLVTFIALGLMIEPALGRWRMLVVIASSAAVSSIASSFVSASLASMGFSGAVFGLLGASIALVFRFHRLMAIGWQGGAGMLLLTLFAVVSQWFTMPIIDHAAHVAGLLTGALLGLVLGSERELQQGDHQPGRALVLLGAISCALWLLAAGRAVQYGEAHDLGTLLRELRENTDPGRAGRKLVYASVLAVSALEDERVGAVDLARASEVLSDVVERGSGSPDTLTILAALEYVLGNPRVAVKHAREADAGDKGEADADWIAELSLYEWMSDPVRAGPGAAVAEGAGGVPALTVVDDAPRTGDVLTLTSPIAHPKGLVAHVLVLEGRELRGFLRLRFGPFRGGQRHFAEGWSEFREGRELSYRITYFDEPAEPLRPGDWQWRYWPWQPEVVEFLDERAAALRHSAEFL
ncbi:MAG: rhomboid family intramembrane serine protease [Deltaproteobacteria bacterium]|nr:rhomboid family intramembrane serine protease [Deltaproteobacteria bacterium]